MDSLLRRDLRLHGKPKGRVNEGSHSTPTSLLYLLSFSKRLARNLSILDGAEISMVKNCISVSAALYTDHP